MKKMVVLMSCEELTNASRIPNAEQHQSSGTYINSINIKLLLVIACLTPDQPYSDVEFCVEFESAVRIHVRRWKNRFVHVFRRGSVRPPRGPYGLAH